MWVKPSHKYQTVFGFVRKTNVYLSDFQQTKFKLALKVENQLYNYALHYLYCTYGRKHIDRKVPVSMDKQYLVAKIKKYFLYDCYQMKRWNVRKLYLSSHNAQLFLTQLVTNFDQYKKQLVRNNKKMSGKDKFNFKMNIQKNKKGKHTNPKHKSWYRIGGIGFNADNRTILIDLQAKCGLDVISMHKISIPDYGIVHIQGNAYNLCTSSQIHQVKLKWQHDNTYQLQLVHVQKKPKFSLVGKDTVGIDWNMIHNKYYHDSDNQKYYISKDVIAKADNYEKQINKLKSRRDRTRTHVKKLNRKIDRLSAKRSQLLTEFYRHEMPKVVGNHQVLVIEQLGAKSMRRSGHGSGCDRGFNRKLSLIKPFELDSILANYAFKHGALVIKVDSYKTSQTEFGTSYVHKHPLNERKFESHAHPGKIIDRDLNAAKNILDWGLHPDHHIKVRLCSKVTPRMVADFV